MLPHKRDEETMQDRNRYVLEELSKTEEELIAADTALGAAETRRAIALTTYATVRDYAAQELGKSPYTLSKEVWPHLENPKAGRFRFARLKPGDAAVQILQECGEPLSLEEIYERLLQGGSEVRDIRPLNAALMNKSEIERPPIGQRGKFSIKGETP